MAKRPSYVSIRARQKNILEGIGTAGLNYKQAARRFGVKPRELKRFVETKPRDLRQNFNRSPAYKKLYGTGTAAEQRKTVRQTVGVYKVKRYKYRVSQIEELKSLKLTPKELRNRTAIGNLVQNLYSQREYEKYDWASYTYNHDLPRSIDSIRTMHRNNKLSNDRYRDILVAWRDAYPGMTNTTFSVYADDLPDDYLDYNIEQEESA